MAGAGAGAGVLFVAALLLLRRARRGEPWKPAAFGLAVIAGYSLIAFGLQPGFPFYEFPMFSGPGDDRARVFARTPGSGPRPVHSFTGWHCPDLQAAMEAELICGGHYPRWKVAKLRGYEHLPALLERRAGALEDATLEVELVQRTWWIRPGDRLGPLQVEDCVVLRCRAREAASGR